MRTSLEKRRERGDMIQRYKLETGIECIEWRKKQHLAPARGDKRAHYAPEATACTPRHHFFTNRTTASWNKLPDNVVKAPSVNSFKSRYDKLQSGCNSMSSTVDILHELASC